MFPRLLPRAGGLGRLTSSGRELLSARRGAAVAGWLVTTACPSAPPLGGGRAATGGGIRQNQRGTLINTSDIADAIVEAAAASQTLRVECDAYLERIAAVWRSFAPPVETGRYVHSIKTERRGARFTAAALRRGVSIGHVYSDDPAAPFIEYGTGDPGGPTPAFAPMRKTYARFLD